MSGHGEKLTRKQELVVSCLLSEDTYDKVAVKAGVSVATLRRWLRLPDFLAAYRQARAQVVESTVAALQQASVKAVATLTRNLDCGVAAAENTAARLILEQSLKGVELMDVLARLEALERLAKKEGSK